MNAPLTHSVAAKAVAFILTVIMTVVSVLSFAGTAFMFSEEVYFISESKFRKDVYGYHMRYDAFSLLTMVYSGNEAGIEEQFNSRNYASLSITEENTDKLIYEKSTAQTEDSSSSIGYTKTVTFYVSDILNSVYYDYYDAEYTLTPEELEEAEIIAVNVTLSLSSELTKHDTYRLADTLITLMYIMRYWIIAIGVISL